MESKLIIEALLFTTPEPLSISKISKIVELPPAEVEKIIAALKEEYKQRSFQIKKIKKGYKLFTKPGYAKFAALVQKRDKIPKLSSSALETIAIIAHRGPITRFEIEDFRGVNIVGVLATLLERGLIKIAGKAQKPGAPFLYDLSDNFYKYFKVGKEEIP